MASSEMTSSDDDDSYEPIIKTNSGKNKRKEKRYFAPEKAQETQFGQFEEFTKGIGSKLLMKMGYKPGLGLGIDGSGIVDPIDVKLRPQKMGLGHGGFDERTETVKKELDEKELEEKELEEKQDSGSLLKSKLKKTLKKSQYKSADELIKEQESFKIIDMTGKEVTERDSFMEIKASKLPELRFNLKVLGNNYQSMLENEARILGIEKKKVQRLEKEIEIMGDRLNNELKKLEVRTMLSKTVLSIQSNYDLLSCKSGIGWDDLEMAFSRDFLDLEHLYYDQVKPLQLDNLVLSCLIPFVKPLLYSWDVLGNPSLGSSVIRKWIKIFDVDDTLLVTTTFSRKKENRFMSCYEAFLYDLWMPRVRDAIHKWNPRSPEPIVLLMETWNDLIPRWIHHNIYEQLLSPKLIKEIQNWNHKKDTVPLYSWLFPWLPIASEKLDSVGVWEQVRLKLGSYLNEWNPKDEGGLLILTPWKEVFSETEILHLVNRNILPKLRQMFKEFSVNPASQDLKPLNVLLEWYHSAFISPTLICNLLVEELFPKWHNVLWKWLGTPSASLQDIADWYLSWKELFPLTLVNLLTRQFRFALDLMNLAMSNPDSLQTTMPHLPSRDDKEEPVSGSVNGPMRLSFFEYVDLSCSRAGIEFTPLVGKVHSETGKPLYKMTGQDGKSRLLYTDQVLYCLMDDGNWNPISVSEALDLIS